MAMRGIDGIVLTFLLNALWQIPAAMAAGLLGARLLRRAPSWQRYIFWLLVAAACVVLPAASLLRSAPAVESPAIAGIPAAREAGTAGREPFFPTGRRPARYASGLGAVVVLGYGFLLLFRGIRLGRTWSHTRGLAHRASPLQIPERVAFLVTRCQQALGVDSVALLTSGEVAGPVTLGALRPAILLPPRFLDDASPEEVVSALGHEMAHVRRRDYAVNLLCEALLLPLAFHPALPLLRRRLAEAREMACDEAVLERLIGRRTYARSLLSLAAGIAGLPRPSYTLGVVDAHTLEVRMKRILDRGPRPNARRSRASLGAALLLLAGIGATASAFSVEAVADTVGDLKPFVGTWRGEWIPNPDNGNKVPAVDVEIRPDGQIVETWYVSLHNEEGTTHTEKSHNPIGAFRIVGRTLTLKSRVEGFKVGDRPAATAEIEESLELQGQDEAVLKFLSNSYFAEAKRRGESVPPPPPPITLKRVS
jgi:beta-lactamase regulating signal transducer with metallopeptidase domain